MRSGRWARHERALRLRSRNRGPLRRLRPGRVWGLRVAVEVAAPARASRDGHADMRSLPSWVASARGVGAGVPGEEARLIGLAGDAETVEPRGDDCRRLNRRHHPVILRSLAEDGTFAPPRPPFICRSRAGRWRREHMPDREGVCLLCDKRLPR